MNVRISITPSFSTPRLTVRDLAELAQDGDARAAFDAALPTILTEPVLRHLPPDLQHTGAGFEAAAWLAVLTSRNAVWIVTRATDDVPIGFLALREETAPGHMPYIWIGYLFAEHAWGQGYATELVAGVVAASRDAGDVRLRAGVAAGNAVSMHVLRKAGFVADLARSGKDWTLFDLPGT